MQETGAAAVLTLTARVSAEISLKTGRKQESSHGGVAGQRHSAVCRLASVRCAGNHRCIVRGAAGDGGQTQANNTAGGDSQAGGTAVT